MFTVIIEFSFKPYYNWNTFNTSEAVWYKLLSSVLNLIITGIPSIQKSKSLNA